MTALYATTCNKETRRETASRLLARAAFLAWGWTELPPIARGEKGKPFFPDRPHHRFNLSHSGTLVLCALSDEGEVGVDVEAVRPHRAGLPRYVMSEEEFASFDGSWEDFTRIWTLKEAYAKQQGGSVFPPRTVPAPPPCAHHSYAGDGWRAALCAPHPPEEIVWVEFSESKTVSF